MPQSHACFKAQTLVPVVTSSGSPDSLSADWWEARAKMAGQGVSSGRTSPAATTLYFYHPSEAEIQGQPQQDRLPQQLKREQCRKGGASHKRGR